MDKMVTEELIFEYQTAKGYRKDDIIMEIFRRVTPLMQKTSYEYNNIPNIDEADKESEFKMIVLNIVDTFDFSKGAKLTTVCRKYFIQAMNKMYEIQTRQKRYDREMQMASFDEILESKVEKEVSDLEFTLAITDTYGDFELMEMLEALPLSDKERMTCKLTMQGVNKSDISRLIKVTPSMVRIYLNNVGKKMELCGCY